MTPMSISAGTRRRTTTTTQAYGEASYWDERYADEMKAECGCGSFDWYQKYLSLAPLFHLYVPPTITTISIDPHHRRTLVVGCGNSAFSQSMIDDGYQDVVNIDISSVVIQAMQNKYRNHPQIKYIQMDVRDMSAFRAGSFDTVVDKGTLDSLLCGNNSQQNATKMLVEIDRVLKDKGVYILITYGAPIYRLYLLKEPCSWTIKLHVIEKIVSRGSFERQWEMTNPVPMGDDGSSVDAVLGNNPDVHYIYVCIKEPSLSVAESVEC